MYRMMHDCQNGRRSNNRYECTIQGIIDLNRGNNKGNKNGNNTTVIENIAFELNQCLS